MSGIFPGQVDLKHCLRHMASFLFAGAHLCSIKFISSFPSFHLLLLLPVQASNGGQSSDYSSSLPSTPVISHKEIGRTFKGEKADSGGPGSVRSVRRRTPRFAVGDDMEMIYYFYYYNFNCFYLSIVDNADNVLSHSGGTAIIFLSSHLVVLLTLDELVSKFQACYLQ